MILTEMLLLMCLEAAAGRVKETVQIALRYVGARGEGEREAPPKRTSEPGAVSDPRMRPGAPRFQGNPSRRVWSGVCAGRGSVCREGILNDYRAVRTSRIEASTLGVRRLKGRGCTRLVASSTQV